MVLSQHVKLMEQGPHYLVGILCLNFPYPGKKSSTLLFLLTLMTSSSNTQENSRKLKGGARFSKGSG